MSFDLKSSVLQRFKHGNVVKKTQQNKFRFLPGTATYQWTPLQY